MIAKCDDATPRPAPRTVCCLNMLIVKLIVADHNNMIMLKRPCMMTMMSTAKLRF